MSGGLLTRDEEANVWQEAVAGAVQQLDDGAMVTRFVVLAEVVGGDSDRALWIGAAPDQRAWDTYGLLRFALAQEDAGMRVGDDR